MGFERFVDWVVGGRFQGALQLTAWLEDPTRYDIIGRIFFDNWPSFWTLLLIFVGAGYLLLWQWRFGLILLLTWLGYVFYALNYIVPDVAVFLIPAQMIMAVWWLAGIVAALDLVTITPGVRRTGLAESVFLLAAILPLLVTTAAQTLPQVDRSADDGRTRWAEAVLDLPWPKRPPSWPTATSSHPYITCSRRKVSGRTWTLCLRPTRQPTGPNSTLAWRPGRPFCWPASCPGWKAPSTCVRSGR